MQVPKITVQQLDLATLVTYMKQGNLQIPRFQREFVWPTSKTRALLDSMFKEFPIGTFFFWQSPKDFSHFFRKLEELNIPEPLLGLPVSYILDGQQRLTSLYVTINGLQVGSRDYGKICIDLQRAAEFSANQDEGYNENIFITRQPTNVRYVSVADLLGAGFQEAYETVPDQWKGLLNNVRNRLTTYPFSVVWVRDQPLAEVVEIFQRINQGGKRLSRYDLVCANLWTPDFDFRKQVMTFNQQLAETGFGVIDETIVTQAFALILRDKCTTATELDLKTEEVRGVWFEVITAVLQAVDFVQTNLGVKRAEFLPYRGILSVLSDYFYHLKTRAMSAAHRQVLWQWFWRVALSERYSSTSPARMAEDVQKMRQLIGGEPVAFTYPSRATVEAVARVRMTSTTSALRNAILCLLALRQPLNFKDNSPVNLSHIFFSTFTKAERHHIFPHTYLQKQGFSARHVHLMANFCFIPAALNKEISNKAPSVYMARYRDENPNFQKAVDSHLIPTHPGSPIWEDNYDAFVSQRSSLIAAGLNQLLESGPSAGQEEEFQFAGKEAETVKFLEIGLRDLIHDRLVAVSGEYYWKQAVPGDVQQNIKNRINQQLAKYPYLSWDDYPVGRTRLDHCDVADYEKIVMRNWPTFGDIFGQKAVFSQHMTSFREFRNSVAHNYESNDVQRKLAEAAIIWLERVINTYNNPLNGDVGIEEDDD
jgi:hypothetical protein